MAFPLRIRGADLETYERCPRAYRLSAEGSRGTRVPSRPLDRWSLLTEAIAATHRNGDPTFEALRDALNRAARRAGFSPACTEEREEILAMLENYAEVAEELGGTFMEPDEPFMERRGRRSEIVLSGREDLIFDHEAVVEARRITTSRYRPVASGEELEIEFKTQVRTLLMTDRYPGRTIRLTEVNLIEGTHSSVERDAGDEAAAGAAVTRFAATVAADTEMAPRVNHLCGNCAHLPGCPAVRDTAPEDIW